MEDQSDDEWGVGNEMSEKGLPARAIYGYDSVGGAWVKVKVDSDGKVYITNTDLTTILSELQNSTYGLAALETLVDEVESLLKNETYGLAALETLVDEAESLLKSETYGLSALKDLLTALAAYVDTEVADIKAKTDNLPSDPADESLLEAKLDRKVQHMDFWADNTAEVTLTTTATADYALNSLVVAGIPSGATLVRVIVMLKIAAIRDTSASNNAVNGATSLMVDADVAYGSLVTAIDIADNSWAILVANATDRGGDVLVGDNDVKTEITGNGTFYARLENIACDGNNLKLEDVAWGVRVYFY